MDDDTGARFRSGWPAGPGFAVTHGGWLAVTQPQRGAGERRGRDGHS